MPWIGARPKSSAGQNNWDGWELETTDNAKIFQLLPLILLFKHCHDRTIALESISVITLFQYFSYSLRWTFTAACIFRLYLFFLIISLFPSSPLRSHTDSAVESAAEEEISQVIKWQVLKLRHWLVIPFECHYISFLFKCFSGTRMTLKRDSFPINICVWSHNWQFHRRQYSAGIQISISVELLSVKKEKEKSFWDFQQLHHIK